MSCIVIYKDGKVEGTQTPSGDISNLYPKLLERTKNAQNAVELTALTHTEKFKDAVITPILSKYRSAVRLQLNTLKPSNPSIQLVHNGEEFTVDVQKLHYKSVLVNGFETIQAFAQVGGESVMLGKVRLKPYKDGLAVESANLGTSKVYVGGKLEGLKGKGIGTEIYKNAINYSLRRGKPFYSDANQTAEAGGVWAKLKSTKLVKQEDGRNKVEAYPSSHFDSKQEVLPKVVINHVLSGRGKNKQLNSKQKLDIRNALLTMPFEDSFQLNDALREVFYVDGEFVIDKNKLGTLYNKYEIGKIISDKGTQKEIKSLLEALNNSQEIITSNVYLAKTFLAQTPEINALGKMVNNNPLATEQEVIQALGGINDEREFAGRLEALSLPFEMGDTSTDVGQEDTVAPVSQIETVTPESSSNYANMTEDGEGNFVFFHSSDEKRDFIDPKRYKSNGSNITSREEAAAIGLVGGVSMYYTDPNDTEKGIGVIKHMIKVAKSEVYDFNSDLLGFIDIARERFKSAHPGKPFDANTQLAYVTQVARDNGYKMVVAEWSGKSRAQTVSELVPFDIQEVVGNTIVKPFKESYVGNREKGYVSNIPKAKDSLLKDLYLRMSKELNAKGDYSSMYHMHYNMINFTQDKITEELAKSKVSQELKDEYAEAIKYEEGTRSSRQRRGVEIQMDSIVENSRAVIERIKGLPEADMDGGTFNIDGSTYDEGGIVVPVVSQNYAQSEITPEKLLEFVEKHKDKIPEGSTIKVGIFKFEGKPEVSLDLNILVSQEHRDTAITFGKEAGQFSLFDLDALNRGDYGNTDIITGATGENPVNFTTEEFVEIAEALSRGELPLVANELISARSGVVSKVVDKLKESGLAKNIYSLSSEEIEAKLLELGDTVSKQLDKGASVTANGFTHDGNVYLNKDTITLDTPIHEMGHLYLNMLREGGRDTYEVLVKGMNLAKSKEAEAYREHVKKNQPKLKEGTPGFYEEVLAQAIGDAGAQLLEGPTKGDFRTWLEEMWDSLKSVMGLSEYMKDKDGKNSPFKTITFNQFTQAIAKDLFDHQTIEGLKASLPYASEGVFLKVKDSIKYKDSKGIDVNAYGVDFIDTTVPVKSLEEVVKEYGGKVFFTTSDCTGIGYDSEGGRINGGPGYTLIKENVEGNIGFAALGESGSKAFETRLLNIYGPGAKVAVMVMAQTPSSTLGNIYGGRYLGRGLRTLKSTLTASEFKEALASIDNIILTNKNIIKSINAFEKSKDGYPLRAPLLELLHNADNYTSEEFAQEFIKDTTFEIRRELMQIIFLKNSNIAMDKSTHAIKRGLEGAGFNVYNFLKEFGDKTFLTDSLIEDDKGGMVLAGFEVVTAKNEKEVKARVAATKGRGITHEQFNGKLASNGGAFVLDGAYDIENNFVSAAEVETKLNPEYEEEVAKEFKKYAKKHRPIVEEEGGISAAEKKRFEAYLKSEGLTGTTEAKRKTAFKDYAKDNKVLAKEYKYMSTKHKIDFKKDAGKANPNLLLVSVPSLQAAVARGVGFAITEQGQDTLVNKVDVGVAKAKAKEVEKNIKKKETKEASLFSRMQEFKRMPEYKLENGELVEVVKGDIKATLSQTLDLQIDNALLNDIAYLAELDEDIYNENSSEVQELIKEVEKAAIGQGIDIIGLSEKALTKGRDAVHNLLASLHNLAVEPSAEAFEGFLADYAVIFDVSTEASEKVLKVGDANMKKSLIHLNTKESEYELFSKHNLVKVSDNIYQVVKKSESLEELYDKLYQVAQYNERALPLEAFPLANEGGVMNLSTVRKQENKEIIVKDIQTFIENKVTELDLPGAGTENSVLQELVAFKYFFNNPMTFKPSENMVESLKEFTAFDGNEEYLANNFVKDFYKDYLRAKLDNSESFESFYSKFSFNENGINLEKNDVITLAEIKDYLASGDVALAEDLMNYSLMTDQIPNLKELKGEKADSTREFQRAFFANSPQSLSKLTKDYRMLAATTVAVKGSTEGFIRVKSGVYELMEQHNNVGFYERIEENTKGYKTFKVEEPTLSVDSSDYRVDTLTAYEVKAEPKKYYTSAESRKIDEENFGCM